MRNRAGNVRKLLRGVRKCIFEAVRAQQENHFCRSTPWPVGATARENLPWARNGIWLRLLEERGGGTARRGRLRSSRSSRETLRPENNSLRSWTRDASLGLAARGPFLCAWVVT